jgi:hypothetical protein
MCLPFLNLSVRYDALLRGWCVAYVGDVSHVPLLRATIPAIQMETPVLEIMDIPGITNLSLVGLSNIQ